MDYEDKKMTNWDEVDEFDEVDEDDYRYDSEEYYYYPNESWGDDVFESDFYDDWLESDVW